MKQEKREFDCLVVGAGPIGLAMARALELNNLTYCLCGELPRNRPNSPDLRTAALFDGSIRLLKRLGAWPHLEAFAAPLDGIRMVDATGHLLRAPEQVFRSRDIDAPQLGFNIPNPSLVGALRTSLAAADAINESPAGEANFTAIVRKVTINDRFVVATLADGTERRARLAIAADGRRSLTRDAAGIAVKTWDHNQAALTAHFDHTLSNQAISTEIHTRAGPCTIVPLTSHRAGLVWMDHPDVAADLADRDDDAFIAALEARFAGLLGPVRTVTVRRVFPLSTLLAERFAGPRVALVGESGHAFPPIGAQGLNLGLRDVASLVDHLTAAAKNGVDFGASSVLNAYSDERRADVLLRTYGVDVLNVSLAGRATGLLRGVMLHATKASPDFKRFLMARGMQPFGAWPTLMRSCTM